MPVTPRQSPRQRKMTLLFFALFKFSKWYLRKEIDLDVVQRQFDELKDEIEGEE